MPALCAVLFHLYFWGASALGAPGAPSLAAHFVQDPTPYFLLARALSAAAGTATTLLVYLVGRESGRSAGLIAALLYAVAPLAVRDAHFGVTDTLMTLLATAAVYGLLRYRAAPAPRDRGWLALTALAIGLAVSAKYPAAVLVPLAVAVVIGKCRALGWRRASGPVLLLLGVTGLAFLLVNPGIVVRWRETAAAVVAIVRAVSRHEAGWSLLPALARVLAPLHYGPGELPGLVAAGLGLGLAWRRGGETRARAAVVAGALLAFLGPLLAARILPFRYVLPALPFVAVLAACGILALRWPGRPAVSRVVTGLLVLASVLPPLGRSIWIDVLLGREDTRGQAGRWIAEHVPPGVPVLLRGGPECEPQIPESRESLARRIGYAVERYGPAAGRVVSELYRLQLQWRPASAAPAREVFRGTAAIEGPGRGVCLVVPSYPLANPACPADGAAAVPGAATVRVRFDAIETPPRAPAGDAVDAFFLPFSGLGSVRRPGPNIEILLALPERGAP
jgi:hypothetical protein